MDSRPFFWCFTPLYSTDERSLLGAAEGYPSIIPCKTYLIRSQARFHWPYLAFTSCSSMASRLTSHSATPSTPVQVQAATPTISPPAKAPAQILAPSPTTFLSSPSVNHTQTSVSRAAWSASSLKESPSSRANQSSSSKTQIGPVIALRKIQDKYISDMSIPKYEKSETTNNGSGTPKLGSSQEYLVVNKNSMHQLILPQHNGYPQSSDKASRSFYSNNDVQNHSNLTASLQVSSLQDPTAPAYRSAESTFRPRSTEEPLASPITPPPPETPINVSACREQDLSESLVLQERHNNFLSEKHQAEAHSAGSWDQTFSLDGEYAEISPVLGAVRPSELRPCLTSAFQSPGEKTPTQSKNSSSRGNNEQRETGIYGDNLSYDSENDELESAVQTTVKRTRISQLSDSTALPRVGSLMELSTRDFNNQNEFRKLKSF
ncbi:hypothetical protein O181_019884 [Austropuccinia psidii MF-1]|uniref:Uncharacterized protein n=1 Tax=Austropuccinia psidii MF-1 TaxID=1389203 RepID=A0A9Q3CAE4_9BASI|nr:hypothetical protein [Austropuccinia psidii MF-1]